MPGGIFGQLDAESIPDNPFKIDQGEYRAVVSNAFYTVNAKKDNQPQLVIAYSITDKDSKYVGREVRDWLDYFPDITDDNFELLPPDEQARIERALSTIKRRLCGQPKRKPPLKGLGVELSDLDENWDPSVLNGTEVDIAVVNSGDNNEFTNIKWVEAV